MGLVHIRYNCVLFNELLFANNIAYNIKVLFAKPKPPIPVKSSIQLVGYFILPLFHHLHTLGKCLKAHAVLLQYGNGDGACFAGVNILHIA